MSISRITISVPERVARRIKKAAGGGSVSAWVTEAIDERLDDGDLDRLWQAFYREVAPTRAETQRADRMFTRLVRGRRRPGAA